ncbi:MAG: hypothetical protein P8K83_03695, partial [Woeseiaceae bacterium]|nr:hypothetical protein [Woeseiaceae bacterium]
MIKSDEVTFQRVLLVLWLLMPPVLDADEKNIAGRWFVAGDDSGAYLFEDGIELVDLFSYHTRDSNDDGIPNVRIGHDGR